MHKVLVVDDEPYMLEGWRLMVDWQAYGYELCGTASDGEDALEAIKAYSPDLVVTDIQMPVMDGLELIRTVKEELHWPVKFIIVSGYSDFRYAKQAIRYQVDHYLLKPLVTEEIHSVLKDLSESIEQVHRSRTKARRETADAASAAVAALLNRGGRQAVADAERLLLADGRSICQLVLVEASDQPANGGLKGDRRDSAAEFLVVQFLEDNLPNDVRVCRFEQLPGRIGLLILGTQMQESVLEDCLSAADLRLDSSVSIYVSTRASGISGLQELYRQAASVRRQPLNGKRAGVHFYRHTGFDAVKQYRFEDMMEKAAGLIRMIEENDLAGIRIAADSLSGPMAAAAEEAEWMQVYAGHIQSLVLRKFLDAGMDTVELINWAPDRRGKESRESWQWVWSGENLEAFCIRSAELFAEHSSSRLPGMVTETIAYIHNHYREKIQLQDLAKRFKISPVYLGQQFKRETGFSFNDFIHKVRIDEAKKMLRRTDMKVSVIAQALGYHDTEYFTGKFKMFAMQSPSSYKNKCKGERHGAE